MNLKEQLISIKENDYQAPLDVFRLVQEMLHHIGSVDPELRDDLIYTTLSQWIQSFGDVEKSPEFLPAFRQRYNIKNFLKSLYFRVKYFKTDADLCPVIEETLYKVEKVYYPD